MIEWFGKFNVKYIDVNLSLDNCHYFGKAPNFAKKHVRV